jgi:superfamily II DNA/RNA helicase
MLSYFDHVSYSASLQEMIDAKYLVPPQLHQIVKRGSDIQDIAKLVFELYMKQEYGNNAIVFMQTINDCKFLRQVFVDAGVPASAVTGSLTGNHRDQVLDDFKRGGIKVLITCNVLTAGFDAPNIEAIFMPYSCKSPTTYLQRSGRGLRLNAGKENCRLYVFGDAPAIASGHYERLQMKILHKGGKTREHSTVMEDFDYNDYDPSSEIYVWTKDLVQIIKQLRRRELPGIAELINSKRFPPKFLKDPKQLLKRLPKVFDRNGQVALKESQRDILLNEGFKLAECEALSRAEGSAMISAIMTLKGNTGDLITHGRFQGKRVSELSPIYRSLIKRKFPYSNVAKQIRAWEAKKDGTGTVG